MLVGSEHEGSVELLSQFGRMTSEPTHPWDSIRHHVLSLEFEIEKFEVKLDMR